MRASSFGQVVSQVRACRASLSASNDLAQILCRTSKSVVNSPTPSLLPPADPLALQFALHGSIALLLGLIGGLFFARAIKTRHGEVAWRVVHAGGCSAGAMLLAIAMPSQWVTLSRTLAIAMGAGFIKGSYLLCAGMYVAAIWDVRGIPGGGSLLNRVVSALYAAGTILALFGSVLLTLGLLRSAFAPAAGVG